MGDRRSDYIKVSGTEGHNFDIEGHELSFACPKLAAWEERKFKLVHAQSIQTRTGIQHITIITILCKSNSCQLYENAVLQFRCL